MKTNLLLVALLSVFLYTHPLSLMSQKESAPKAQTETAVVSTDLSIKGMPVMKIKSEGRNVEDAILRGQRYAVGLCLFPNKELPNLTPICTTEGWTKHNAYFRLFLEDEGDYLNFVRLTTDGFPLEGNRKKTENGYQVTIKVEVLYNELRSEMRKEQIID